MVHCVKFLFFEAEVLKKSFQFLKLYKRFVLFSNVLKENEPSDEVERNQGSTKIELFKNKTKNVEGSGKISGENWLKGNWLKIQSFFFQNTL